MRLVLISDTHLVPSYGLKLPKGDVLVHAGDFCNSGSASDCEAYCLWLKQYKNKYSGIVHISGNHDFIGEENPTFVREQFKFHIGEHLHYLDGESVIIDGIKFYGEPRQPEFCNWAFNIPRNTDELKNIWAKVPDDTDVLVSHGPPRGILDLTQHSKEYVGDDELLARVNELPNLKLHVFGHIHEAYGTVETEKTTFVNASMCTLNYHANNKPFVFDIISTPHGKEVVRVFSK